MKTKKIFAFICCAMLLVTLTGCFPFNIVQNILQNNQSGGSDGPTSVIVSEEPSEIPSDMPSEEPTEEYDFEDDFAGFDDLEDDGDDTDVSDIKADAIPWFNVDDNDVMWLFADNQAALFENESNYTFATFESYYNEDAVQYIANELAEYGLTEEDQRSIVDGLAAGEKYYFIMFSDLEVYENDVYVSGYEDDVILYVGYETTDDDIIYYDLINMDSQEVVSFYTYSNINTANTGFEDTQRIGSAETGYVDIPADYVKYTDPSLPSDFIQYADSTGTNIVTLSYYDNDISAKAYAGAMVLNFQQDTEMDQSSVTGATVELDGCEAYQVYGYYPDDDLFLVTWFYDSPEDDYIHYVAVEFASDNYELFEMVEDTYRLAY